MTDEISKSLLSLPDIQAISSLGCQIDTIIISDKKYVPTSSFQTIALSLIASAKCTLGADLPTKMEQNNFGCVFRIVTHTRSSNQDELPFSPLSWKLFTLTEKGAPKP